MLLKGKASSSSEYLIVFAKEPEFGFVKTRLAEVVGHARAVDLYKAFVRDTLDLGRATGVERRVLAYESGPKGPAFLQSIAKGFELVPQSGADLGERMHRAFVDALKGKDDAAVIIGTDLPGLPPDRVDEAFAALKDHDLVLGPVDDGGYYLVGLKTPCPELFRDIRWSSAGVLSETVVIAESLNLRIALLSPWNDIDSYADLEGLKRFLMEENPRAAPHTRKVLQKMVL